MKTEVLVELIEELVDLKIQHHTEAGLKGTPDIELRRQEDRYLVCLYPLQGYVKRQVIKQLLDARSCQRLLRLQQQH
jgi:hypothetical protein